jgi:hypothetical protein
MPIAIMAVIMVTMIAFLFMISSFLLGLGSIRYFKCYEKGYLAYSYANDYSNSKEYSQHKIGFCIMATAV